jgi:putative ABC transport system ATP-binding protein
MNELIKIRSLSKTFGRVEAVRDISFDIMESEFLTMQGHSGCGKTTLLSLLAGLEKADNGEILFGKRDLTKMDEDELALFRRENIGIVFQSFNLIPTLNVVENVAFPLFPMKIAKNKMIGRAQGIAKDVGLSHRLSHYPSELSGGEQQRVAIARSLVNNPKIIFADEPTGNLDSKTGKIIIELLREFNKKKKLTVVMVTHDDDIAKNSDRIIKLKDGMIVNE